MIRQPATGDGTWGGDAARDERSHWSWRTGCCSVAGSGANAFGADRKRCWTARARADLDRVYAAPTGRPSYLVGLPLRALLLQAWSGSAIRWPRRHRATRLASTLGADKAYNVADFIMRLRKIKGVRLRKIKGKRPMNGAEKGFDGRRWVRRPRRDSARRPNARAAGRRSG